MKPNPWISSQPERLPDFIIGGAMKSGTTTLHQILASHPDVGLAHDELGFFDMDSLLQHPDFNFYDKGLKAWLSPSMAQAPEILWNWYYSQFDSLRDSVKLIGEDSTTYLASSLAAERIAGQNKPIKLIFILRQPTKRSISHYLHLLKSGRAIYSLEDTINYLPDTILRRSLYKTQLESYYRLIPAEQIKVIIFEEFIKNPATTIKDICKFLGIAFEKLHLKDLEIHANPTKTPNLIGLQLFRNKVLQGMRAYRYANFHSVDTKMNVKIPLRYRFVDKIHKLINPHKINRRFEVNPATERLLDNYFKTELNGLDDLIQQNAMALWFNQNNS